MSSSQERVVLGLKENWKQFSLLVLVNAFVGGMIGLERSIFPQFAAEGFGVESKSAILSFIIAFGISKAIANYYAGKLANSFGRKKLLIVGWIIALPIPFILIWAPHWYWVVVANLFLGISQGLTWSSTVLMKIDLVGQKHRGFAMGLNEFSGYIAVGIVAFLSGLIAENYGVTPYPFYLGIGLSIVGFIVSIIWVNDTQKFVQKETLSTATEELNNLFTETTVKNKALSAITQAGFVNNLNDGMIWGLLPMLLLTQQFDIATIGILSATYPTIWGIGQLFTGKMSDHYSKKKMLYWGMLLQGLSIIALPFSNGFFGFFILCTTLGIGTALVYPTFMSAIADRTSPNQRAEVIGIFRLWRDLGYAFGAFLSGLIADLFGIEYAIYAIGVLTLLSSMVIKFRMPESGRN